MTKAERVFKQYWQRLRTDPYFRHCQEYALWIEDDRWCWEYRLIHGEGE